MLANNNANSFNFGWGENITPMFFNVLGLCQPQISIDIIGRDKKQVK
jgi:hypothetical protein